MSRIPALSNPLIARSGLFSISFQEDIIHDALLDLIADKWKSILIWSMGTLFTIVEQIGVTIVHLMIKA